MLDVFYRFDAGPLVGKLRQLVQCVDFIAVFAFYLFCQANGVR